MSAYKATSVSRIASANVVYTGTWTPASATVAALVTEANAVGTWVKWAIALVAETTTETKRYVGINFRMHDEAAYAKVNIYNYSSVLQATGATHTNTTVNGLSSTLGLVAGMLIEGTDIAANTKIISVDGPASITISRASTGTHTGLTFSFYECLHNNKTVDLYTLDFDYTSTYTTHVMWYTIPNLTENLRVYVEHNATHNTACAGATFPVQIEGFVYNNPITDAVITTTLTTWDSTYPTHTYVYTLAQNVVATLDKIEYFNGTGVITDFTLAVTNHAHEFTMFTIDGGTSWKYPTDALISWGSNSPDYDNDTINATGNMTIKFITAPITGVNNVGIKFLPMVTHYNLTRTMGQPYTTSYIDYQHEVRLLDDALELIL